MSTSSLQRYSLHLSLTLALALLLVIVFGGYVYAEKEIDRANELRQQSILMADQLRQSSDDLSRLARTYAATGQASYRRHFFEVLDIRDGRKPRPQNYQDAYWDLVMDDDVRPSPPGPAISLLALVRQAGFPDNEIAALAEAKRLSDQLVSTETAAMDLVAAAPADVAQRERATAMLVDQNYHQAKAAIMRAINHFTHMTEQRTHALVDHAAARASMVRWLLIGIALWLMALIWRLRGDQHAILGGSVGELTLGLAQLGNGDYSRTVKVAAGMEHSVLGRIAATNDKLALLDTERALAERALADHGAKLESLVAERTAELAAALHQAEAANRAKSVFLSNMSHELRTPLNAVIGFARLIGKSAALDDETQQNVDIISRSGSHLLTLINEVLELSKIESGNTPVHPEWTDVRALAREVVDMLKPRGALAGIALTLETVAVPDALLVDATKLRQVLINLVGNAVKFTREGGVLLMLRAGAPEDGRVRLVVEVRDTGIGIAPHDLASIFEPFVQKVTHATTAGTGLGLAICRRYLELLGATLSVRSVLHQGSTFAFALTLEAGSAAALAAPAPAARGAHEHSGRGGRVLIVDDSEDARRLLRALLEPLDFEVVEAADGQAAVALAARVQPVLVIMDWRMPGLDGLEASRQIRALSAAPPPIVLHSASALAEQRQQASELGITDFLSKPLQEEQLYAALERLLGVRRVCATAPAATAAAAWDGSGLERLDGACLLTLRDAVQSLDAGTLARAIAHVGATEPALAQGIEQMCASLRHKQLWDLLDAALRQHSEA